MRNYGLKDVRAGLGGNEHQPARTRDSYASRDSNLPDDRELTALIFAGLCAAPLIVTSIVLFYLAQ